VLDQIAEDTRFNTLMDQMKADPAALKAFQADPLPRLRKAGIPLLPAVSMPPAAQAFVPEADVGVRAATGLLGAGGEQIRVSAKWWGIDFVMNEKLTQDIISGVTAGGPLAGAIAAALGAAGVVTGGIATAIGAAFAAVFALKAAEIKIIDNGNGVHWPVSWVQWAALLAAVPGGPAVITAAAMAFIHPVRN
jgi:hypothetical protein